MRVLPISFSHEMIPPIMDGSKQRTRRVISASSSEDAALMMNIVTGADVDRCKEELLRTSCPYDVGDILYVREDHLAYGFWKPEGMTAGGNPKWVFKTTGSHYFPDEVPMDYVIRRRSYRYEGWYKRLGRFMPKKYARTFLKVTNRRIETLQEISLSEAVLEGVGGGPVTGWKDYTPGSLGVVATPILSFQTLIDKLHGTGTFKMNPLVWVFSFDKVERPANFLTSKIKE